MILNGASYMPYQLLSWAANLGDNYVNTTAENFDFINGPAKELVVKNEQIEVGHVYRLRQFFRYGSAGGVTFTFRLNRMGGVPAPVASIALPPAAIGASRGLLTADLMCIAKSGGPVNGNYSIPFVMRFRTWGTIGIDSPQTYSNMFGDVTFNDMYFSDYFNLKMSYQMSVAAAGNQIREEFATWERLAGEGLPGNS